MSGQDLDQLALEAKISDAVNAMRYAEARAACPVVERMAVWIAHLEAFIGPSAIPTLRASLAEGRSPGGAARGRAQEVQP